MAQETAAPKRKYRALKKREKWSPEEHKRFLEALNMYGRDWMKITQHVVSKSRVQVRSHAQKHFLKMEKLQKQSGKGSAPPKSSSSSLLLDQQRDGADPLALCQLEMATPDSYQNEQLRSSSSEANVCGDPDGSSFRILSSFLECAEPTTPHQNYTQGVTDSDLVDNVNVPFQPPAALPNAGFAMRDGGIGHMLPAPDESSYSTSLDQNSFVGSLFNFSCVSSLSSPMETEFLQQDGDNFNLPISPLGESFNYV
eukprot:Plantae.Rhodophyta-Purpureofilum_apyrenoidigerum.ctg33306.p1 GENE.Plantae.Rhodophyta-Purpureofilum_apyrenoidigerum.ctg33306~~Plantae.Rhodophyta-Purpureofilum_apyrenoidigerum.ctg33306.p1  ORF type:complete len:254 (-),score=49.62 Plantae.Rhodophyta-Purpureofilum_apyrenoidigerum.ctg33306:270-1031(-)